MERMNRRAVIRGASTTLAALAIPTVATASAPTESNLDAIIAQWQSDYEALTIEGRAVDNMELALRETQPAKPEALITPIAVPVGCPAYPSNGIGGWSIRDLNYLLRDKTLRQIVKRDLGAGLVAIAEAVPLPEAVLDRVEQVKQMRLAHDAAIVSHFADHQTRQEAWEQTLSDADVLFETILETRPSSWAQLHRKIAWLQSKHPLDIRNGVADQFDFTENLIADIQAVA